MEQLIKMSRELSSIKYYLRDALPDTTINEALLLNLLSGRSCTLSSLSENLMKDRSYISKILKKMIEGGFIERDNKFYLITPQGRRKSLKASTIIKEYFKENERLYR